MFLEKFGFLLPGIPAVGLAICVGASLFSYQAPTYGKDSSSTESVAQSADSTSTEAAAVKKGNFDLDDGVYRGTGVGFSGNTVVDVTISDKTITAIDIISEEDTDAFFNRAKEGVIKEILEQQSYDVDAVSGATYSSRGIKNAVKNALTGEEDTSTRGDGGGSSTGSTESADVSDITEGTFEDGTYTGSGQGFSGTTTVRVTVKDHKITNIEVLSHADADSYFNKAKSGVISAIISGNTTNVDTVSGATYSSRGIINAVRNALGLSSSGGSSGSSGGGSGSGGSSGGSASVSKVSESGSWKDGTYTGSASGSSGGFNGGTTRVSVTISGGKITSITVLSNQDTAQYFNRAKSKIINSIISKQSTNVDTVSGASFSSRGIINAVRNALSKAEGSNSGTNDSGNANTGTNTSKSENTSQNNSNNAENTPIEGEYTDGTYSSTASCTGTGFDYTITTTVTIKGNKITSVTATPNDIDSTSRSFFDQANASVPGNIVDKQSTSVDVVSGATYSSNAIMKGAADAIAQAKTDTTVDRTALNQAINNANARVEKMYTPSTWKTFSHALTAAKAVKGIDGASQSDIDAQTEALNKAMDALVQRADKSQLESTINSITQRMNQLTESDYEADKWTALKTALSNAQTVYDDPETVQTDADNAKTALETAFNGLTEETFVYWAAVNCKQGRRFDYYITTTITVQGGKIVSCTAKSSDSEGNNAEIDEDSVEFLNSALNDNNQSGVRILDDIVNKQSADNVDTVSGATYSSNAIIKGAETAIENARNEGRLH